MTQRVIRRAASLAVMLMTTFTAAVHGESPSPLPVPGIPQSCGIQLKTHNFTPETLQQTHDLGFRLVRRGFYWNTVEAVKGTYDFSSYDVQMAEAKRLGFTVVGVLFNGNKAYEDDKEGGIQTEAGRQGFAKFGAALVAHYADQPVIWEIWNEPNVRTFWRSSGMHNSEPFADEYTDLVKATVPAMLASNPDAFIAAGSVSNYWEPSYQWTEFCFKKGILETGIKAWSVHPYGVKTPEEFSIGHERTRALLKQYGKPEMPMIDSERGFAVKETQEGWSGGSIERAREFQAWHIVRQFMMDLLHDVRLTIWYEWDGDKFGLVDDAGKPRPGYGAFEDMIKELDGYRLTRRLEAEFELDYVLLFEKEGAPAKLVAWTAPSPGGAPDEARDHEVTIANGATPITLALTGKPQYLTLPADSNPGRCTLIGGIPQIPARKPAAGGKAAAGIQAKVGGPTQPVDLALFAAGSTWKVSAVKKGKGEFALAVDDAGKTVGTFTWDFTESDAAGTPYVMAQADVAIPAGATSVTVQAKSAIGQQITLRLIDSTGQTHQFKRRVKGTGKWETLELPLTRKAETWGGAKDGVFHFPLKQLHLSIPRPSAEATKGTVAFAAITAQLPVAAEAPEEDEAAE